MYSGTWPPADNLPRADTKKNDRTLDLGAGRAYGASGCPTKSRLRTRPSSDATANMRPSLHMPDKANPVVFRLQKLVGAEPMLKFITNAEVDVARAPVVLNVETGKLGTDGDLSFSILTGTKGQYGPDFTITITAGSGAAFAFSEEEFMSNAPEAGYQTAAFKCKFHTINVADDFVIPQSRRHGDGSNCTPQEYIESLTKDNPERGSGGAPQLVQRGGILVEVTDAETGLPIQTKQQVLDWLAAHGLSPDP